MKPRQVILTFLLLFFTTWSFAQKGPGGISSDTSDIGNCRLWFDARDLDYLGDGDEVTLWLDKSVSPILDSAFWLNSYANSFPPPVFRTAASAGINGRPTVSFESGGMLLIGENTEQYSVDLSSSPDQYTNYNRTIFLVFRTGANVSDRQYLWEQGGGWRGINAYIHNEEIYIGAYDIRLDPEDTGAGSVVPFGFTYKTLPIEPNTTYVLDLVLDAPLDNSIDFSGSALRGNLNGQSFNSEYQHIGNLEPGIGGLGTHDDPVGIGGVNQQTANDLGFYSTECYGAEPCLNIEDITGDFLFQGRMAEICFWANDLNETERIIVQNYLAAKFAINLNTEDYYEHQTAYGNGLIGLGKSSTGEVHSHSKGDNIFAIKADPNQFIPEEGFVMIGHNGGSNSWNNPIGNTESHVVLNRIWKADISGAIDNQAELQVEIPIDDLAPLPNNYSKYGLIIALGNEVLPDFSAENTRIIELAFDEINQAYTTQTVFPDDAYISIVAFNPTVQFDRSIQTFYEGDPPDANPTVFIPASLNYFPAEELALNCLLTDGSAQLNIDFSPEDLGLNFNPSSRKDSISVFLLNDLDTDLAPLIEFIVSFDTATADINLNLGTYPQISIKIIDNDYAVFCSFQSPSANVQEDLGTYTLPIIFNSPTPAPTTVRISILDNSNATDGQDYSTAASDWNNLPDGRRFTEITVNQGALSATVEIPIIDDLVDEDIQNINFMLETISGAGTGELNTFNLQLEDNDPLPTLNFSALQSEGFEGITEPRIAVNLSQPSEKTITAEVAIIGGSAANGFTGSQSDYFAETASTVYFQPGDTTAFLYQDPANGNINLIIEADGIEEEAETIEFELTGEPANCVLGTLSSHTYTILDYEPIGWLGVAGIGNPRDNTFYLDLSSAEIGALSLLENGSPQPIQFTSNGENRPTIQLDAAANTKALVFDGSNDRLITGSSEESGRSIFINTGNFYDSKSIFFAFKPELVSQGAAPQVIFEQGGAERGLNVYLNNGQIYFQVWNTLDDDAGNLSPWGGNDSYAVSQPITYGSDYVVSCHYNRQDENPLEIYINGISDGVYQGEVGRLYGHQSQAAIGGVFGGSRFFDGSFEANSGRNFKGILYEMLYYNEPTLNSPRIDILHNYLSAKFKIPLTEGQHFDLTYSEETDQNNKLNSDVCGVGNSGGSIHGDSQGAAELRLRNIRFPEENTFLMWGHNNEEFSSTWEVPEGSIDLEEIEIAERSGKVWRFHLSESADSVLADVFFDFGELQDAGSFSGEELLLLLHNNQYAQDFSNSTAILDGRIFENSRVVVFEDVPINDGFYLAIANSSAIPFNPEGSILLTGSQENRDIDLSWETQGELETEHFAVERTGVDFKWKEIARLSPPFVELSYLDKQALRGRSYYRIKNIDADGQFSYSNTIAINYEERSQNEIILFPNPLNNGLLNIVVPQSVSKTAMDLEIYDAVGNIVWTGKTNPEQAVLQLDIQGFNSGLYILSFRSPTLEKKLRLAIARD